MIMMMAMGDCDDHHHHHQLDETPFRLDETARARVCDLMAADHWAVRSSRGQGAAPPLAPNDAASGAPTGNECL